MKKQIKHSRLFSIKYFLFSLVFTLLLFPQLGYSKIIELAGVGLFSSSKLAQAGITHVSIDKQSFKKTIIHFLDDKGKVLHSLELDSSAPSVLKNFAPSKLNQYLHHLKTKSGSITVHKLKAFPYEAFSFFAAIGAITSAELIFNYNKNPLAMDQFLTQQADPVGQVGFAAFIVANGLAAEPLMMVTTNPTLRTFIPYMGMSVGMIASNIVHEIGHFPHLTECALERKNCDKAYEAWLDYDSTSTLANWTPGLASMILSTVAAGSIELGIRSLATKVIKTMGAELVLSLTPTGWVAAGGRFLYKVSQLAGFIYIDQLIHEPLVNLWENSTSLGPKLKTAAAMAAQTNPANIVTSNQEGCSIQRKRRDKEACLEDEAYHISRFDHISKEWQTFILTSVLTKHQNWSDYLSQLSAQYFVSKNFYFDFHSDAWKGIYQNAENYIPLIQKSAPLYGVNTSVNTSPADEAYFLMPDTVEKEQLNWITSVLSKYNNQNQPQTALSKSSSSQAAWVNRIFDYLNSNQVLHIGQGIELLNYYSKLPHPHNPELTTLLNNLRIDIGINATPLLTKGSLYLEILPKINSNYQSNPFTGFLKPDANKNLTSYLVTQMLTGPNAKSNLISSNLSGFKASFTPPRVTDDSIPLVYDQPKKWMPFDLIGNITFAHPTSNANQSALDLLIYSNKKLPAFSASSAGSEIALWWKAQVEPQLFIALDDYASKYSDIIHEFKEEHFKIDQISWQNRSGGFHNSALALQNDIFRFYLAKLFSLRLADKDPLFSYNKNRDQQALDWAHYVLDLQKNKLLPAEMELISLTNTLLKISSNIVLDAPHFSDSTSMVNLQSLSEKWLEQYQALLLELPSEPNERVNQALLTAVDYQIKNLINWTQIISLTNKATFNGESLIKENLASDPRLNKYLKGPAGH